MGVLVGMLELWPSPEIGDLPALTVLATLLAPGSGRAAGRALRGRRLPASASRISPLLGKGTGPGS